MIINERNRIINDEDEFIHGSQNASQLSNSLMTISAA